MAPAPGSAATDGAPRPHASDRAIAERVLQALFPGPLLRRERIRIVVAAGQVTLSGTVATVQERSTTEWAARGVSGVDGVTNLVAVQAEEWTAPTFLGPAAAYRRDGESGSVAGRIEALFERDAEIDDTWIGIAAQGGDAWESLQRRTLTRDRATRDVAVIGVQEPCRGNWDSRAMRDGVPGQVFPAPTADRSGRPGNDRSLDSAPAGTD